MGGIKRLEKTEKRADELFDELKNELDFLTGDDKFKEVFIYSLKFMLARS